MIKKCLSLIAIAALCAPAASLGAAKQPLPLKTENNLAVDFSRTVITPRVDMPESCSKVGLDDDQKTQITDSYFEFRKQLNTLGAEVKNAMMDAMRTFSSATSTREDAAAAQGVVKEKMDAVQAAHGEFNLKVFYDILKADQRAPAMQCIKDWMKAKKKK